MSILLSDSGEAPANVPEHIDMQIEKIDLGEINNFSPIFLDYIKGEPTLKKFYHLSPKKENFKQMIGSLNFPKDRRKLLSEVLTQQYSNIKISEKVAANIQALHDETSFTITTGHQLNIFTGPLYFIYKIITTINATRQLKTDFPEYNFIPVYWMASEDHDFEEINHFNLFGKTYTWNSEQKGAVGKFNPEELKDVIEQLPEFPEFFKTAYLKHNTLTEATRYLVNTLFGEEGLIILDGDNSLLKSEIKDLMKEELTQNHAHKMVQKTSSELAALGYKLQVTPREINLFYLDKDLRDRIVNDHDFQVLNTELKYTEEEILDLVDQKPEKFSPNVILRPLYQEIVLPNLAYIGGPAEMAYWLQLKPLFDHYKLSFPILMPRNFGLIINKNMAKKINKNGLSIKDLFMDLQSLKTKFLKENSENVITLDHEKDVLKQVFQSILHKGLAVDQSLEGMIGAESAKTQKGLENIEKKLRKAEELKQETAIKQIENIKDKLFPGDGLQERKENILNFYINNPSIINFLLNNLDPFDYRFHVVIENE
ncbi:bacillithiol biosynthesis cysteine-adding enzyme BshC [soil metagenome]